MAHRIVLVCVGLVFGGTLAAQQRAIAGKVTGSLDGKAIAGASVAVVGTARLAATNGSGEYTVLAPAGPVTLSVRAVGYKRKVLNVSGEQTTADVVLEADIFNLDAIVVTGQATGVEQRNLANAVTTVRAEDLNRAPTGTLEGALHAPYPAIDESLKPGGMLREVAAATGRRVVFFCAFGERSAMAVASAREAGLANTAHIAGGIDAWKKAGGPVVSG